VGSSSSAFESIGCRFKSRATAIFTSKSISLCHLRSLALPTIHVRCHISGGAAGLIQRSRKSFGYTGISCQICYIFFIINHNDWVPTGRSLDNLLSSMSSYMLQSSNHAFSFPWVMSFSSSSLSSIMVFCCNPSTIFVAQRWTFFQAFYIWNVSWAWR